MSLKAIPWIFISLILIMGSALVLINGANQVNEMNLGEHGNETRAEVVPFIRDAGLMFGRAFTYGLGGLSILIVVIWMNGKRS